MEWQCTPCWDCSIRNIPINSIATNTYVCDTSEAHATILLALGDLGIWICIKNIRWWSNTMDALLQDGSTTGFVGPLGAAWLVSLSRKVCVTGRLKLWFWLFWFLRCFWVIFLGLMDRLMELLDPYWMQVYVSSCQSLPWESTPRMSRMILEMAACLDFSEWILMNKSNFYGHWIFGKNHACSEMTHDIITGRWRWLSAMTRCLITFTTMQHVLRRRNIQY